MNRLLLLALFISTTSITLAQSVTRNVLLESVTCACSGWSVDADVITENLSTLYPNRLIPAVHHRSDPMSNNEGNDIQTFFGAFAFPIGAVDRTFFPGEAALFQTRGTWANNVATQINTGSPVEIDLTTFYDTTSREITVAVKAHFTDTASGDLRLHFFALEDSVTGAAGSGYDQINNYAQNGGSNPDPAHPFYTEPATITGFNHRNVVRKALNSENGISGLFPAFVQANSTYHDTIIYAVPQGFNAERMSVVAFIAKYEQSGFNFFGNEVLNAQSQRFRDGGWSCPSYFEPLFLLGGQAVDQSFSVAFGTLPGGYNIWDFGDGNTLIDSSDLVSHTYDTTGNYTVCITQVDSNGFSCETFCQDVPVFGTGVETLTATSLNLKVYPNPIRDLGLIEFQLPQTASVHVFLTDLTGRMVRTLRQDRLVAGQHAAALDATDLAAGVYLVNLLIDGQLVHHKIVVGNS